jgi:hypothetical protein
MDYRKELQQKYLFFHKQRSKTSYNGIRKTWKWLRRHYLNLEVKDSLDTYEYSKHLRNQFLKFMAEAFIKSTVFSFAVFLWMRLVKHKGKKDLYFLAGVNAFIGFTLFSTNCYYFLMKTRLPLSKTHLDYRKELIEEFIFGCNKSIVLTEEIKKISKFYLPHKIEHSFVTSLGQKVTLIVMKGRLYLSCENYAEVFGYGGKNKLAKMDLLNVMVVREREIIYGLFKLYDILIDKYMDKNKIEAKPKNFETQILEEIAQEMNLNEKQIEMLVKSRRLKNIQFDRLKLNKTIQDEEKENNQAISNSETMDLIPKNEFNTEISSDNGINKFLEEENQKHQDIKTQEKSVKKRFYI